MNAPLLTSHTENPRSEGVESFFVRLRWPLLLCIALLYIGTSFVPAIFDETEGQYSAAAKEMLQRGDWIIPSNDTIPRLQKPPFVYWTQMVAMRVFGVNEFAARLPNALFSLVWFGAVYLVGRRLGGEALGVAGAGILATMMGVYIFCHLIMPEPFLAAFITLAFWTFLEALHQPDRARFWMCAAWLFMALGTFSKGLHGALYPLGTAAVVAWWFPATRGVWKQLAQVPGILLFLLITIPWYIAVEFRYPGFLMEHFVNEQIGHLFDSRYPPDSERVSLLIFFPMHLVYYWPWVLFAIPAIRVWRSDAKGPGFALLLAWVVLTFVSILPSALQDYYSMTCWGAVALFLALPWARGRARGFAFAGGMLAALAALAFLVAVWMASLDLSAPAHPDPVAARDNILNALQGFPVEIWSRMLPLLVVCGVALALGAAGCFWGRRRNSLPPAWTGIVVMMGLILVCAARGLALVEDYFSLKKVGVMIESTAEPNALVVAEDEMRLNTSLLFYFNGLVHWVNANPDAEFPPRVLGLGRELYLEPDAVLSEWKSDRQVFLVVEQERLPKWLEKLGATGEQTQPVAVSGTRKVIRNR